MLQQHKKKRPNKSFLISNHGKQPHKNYVSARSAISLRFNYEKHFLLLARLVIRKFHISRGEFVNPTQCSPHSTSKASWECARKSFSQQFSRDGMRKSSREVFMLLGSSSIVIKIQINSHRCGKSFEVEDVRPRRNLLASLRLEM